MTTAMPVLETERLVIRPFIPEDLDAADRVLSNAWEVPDEKRVEQRAIHERWLRWTVANYESLADLRQPPYGDRAITLKESGELIGSVGLVPAFGPFGRLPEFPANQGSPYFFPEVGLYWAIDPARQGRGYATEAGRGLIDYAFAHMNLGRIIATTEYTNERSMAVMRKLGMTILRNPRPEPEWFQIVGLLNRV
jgi:RimJ/RimL family protein N-acetyltransferase